jgi:1-deoxy-D-xylulose-5-phosphate synthase
MVLMAPKDENDLRHMLKTAINHPGPAALRYPRGNGIGIELEEEFRDIPLGKGEVLKEGEDVLLIAIGNTVQPAMNAAGRLDAQGIRVSVIDARFVKPLDSELIVNYARRIGRVITVEENVLQGGFGSAVLELFQELAFSPKAFLRLGLPDSFIPHGSQTILRNLFGIDAEGIENAVHRILKTHHGQTLHAIGQATG